jgi:uncharacterized protein (DUF1330 family)
VSEIWRVRIKNPKNVARLGTGVTIVHGQKRSTDVAAYVISEVDFLDLEAVGVYRRLAAASIEKYGGRYLVRGGPSELIEGQPQPKNLIVVEFQTMEIAKAWYGSKEYAEALKVREKALDRRLVFVQGV